MLQIVGDEPAGADEVGFSVAAATCEIGDARD